MLVDYTRVRDIFMVAGKTDMRRGIDGLASIVAGQFNMDPFDNAIFLFCGTRKDSKRQIIYFIGVLIFIFWWHTYLANLKFGDSPFSYYA
ncbi:MAG: transposase [Turicibacter sp.]|nr:transposase [Turicibacter sp.]